MIKNIISILLIFLSFQIKAQESYLLKELKLGLSASYFFDVVSDYDGSTRFTFHQLMLNGNVSTSLTKNINIGVHNLWFDVHDKTYASTKDNYNIRGAFIQYKIFESMASPDKFIFTIEASYNKGNLCHCDKSIGGFSYSKVENLDFIGFGSSVEVFPKNKRLGIEMGWYFYKNINVSSYFVHHYIVGINYTFKKRKKENHPLSPNAIKTLD